MALPHISESEWTIMEELWEDSPRTALELTRALEPKTRWAENTVRTMLTRLVDKGALRTGKNASGTRTFQIKQALGGRKTVAVIMIGGIQGDEER